MKTLTIDLPSLGLVDISLSDLQIDTALKDGKILFEKRDVQYYRSEDSTTSPQKDSFSSNRTDWSKYLSQITSNDIMATLELAKKQEEEIKRFEKFTEIVLLLHEYDIYLEDIMDGNPVLLDNERGFKFNSDLAMWLDLPTEKVVEAILAERDKLIISLN
jgi:hypothetical protein